MFSDELNVVTEVPASEETTTEEVVPEDTTAEEITEVPDYIPYLKSIAADLEEVKADVAELEKLLSETVLLRLELQQQSGRQELQIALLFLLLCLELRKLVKSWRVMMLGGK